MPIFQPRTIAPNLSDTNWIHVSKGGTNLCILIVGNSCLPNCVGYAWGRWTELLKAPHDLSRGNAEVWYGKNDGYKRGKLPKLGAVACWSQGIAGVGSDGAGHVAIVEDILQDGSIVISNSAYAGSTFYMRTILPPYNIGGSFVFQGFIYPPVEFTARPMAILKSVDVIAKEVLNGLWGNGADRKAKLTAAGYDYNTVQAKVDFLYNIKYPVKSTDEVAREVIQGKWGNGLARKNALTKAGYDYYIVQAKVEQLLR